VEAETAARRDLADFLVDQLSVKDTDPMSQLTTPLTIRYAARSDRGLVRDSNQDVAYAGSRLLAVADGFGTDGGRAGSGAVDALKALETEVADGLQGSAPPRAGDLLNALEDAVQRADAAVHGLDGSGTTLTAMLWTGSRLALVHIGDTRAYLLRDGMFFQITHDHTVVQSMVDEGSLDAEEAASHPQRAMLLRALDGRPGLARPDLRLHEAKPGDRYLLCSDGLFVAVPHAGIRRTVESAGDPEDTVTGLIALAHEAGAPDNVACVVADVVGEAVPA
jgi:protein phosphatase